MDWRTDMADERRELVQSEEMDGVESQEEEKNGIKISRIRVVNEKGEAKLNKPVGQYITIEVPPLSDHAQIMDDRLYAVSEEIAALLPKEGTILVVGLGNSSITPDALGPKAAGMVLATRHIKGELERSTGMDALRSVTVLAPGVLGQTGMESSEILAGIVKETAPAAVIVVDALASRRLARLGCTVQISDSGISPGSGVGNKRKEISKATLGVPVVSIGVPTVVDAATLVLDLLEEAQSREPDQSLKEKLEPRGARMIITPREIDLLIDRASHLVGMAINCALHPSIDPEEFLQAVS